MAELKNPKFVRFGGGLSDVLEEHQKGIDDNYNLIVQQIEDASLKSSHMCELLKQFIGAAHLLDKTHKHLVHKMLDMNWVVREREIVELFHLFLLELVATNPVHQVQVLGSLVFHFQPASCILKTAEICIPQEDIFQIIHGTIRSVCKLIPTSTTVMFPLLASKYPYVKRDTKIIEWYIKNVLFLTTYLPSLRVRTLELIVSKTLELDTLSPKDEIQALLAEKEEIFDMELEDTSNNMKNRGNFVEKLDVVMDILLTFISDICSNDGELSDQAEKFFEDLILVFDKVLLPVHGCSHIQFIIFYICGFKQTFHEFFIKHLWKKTQNPNTPVLLRQTAMSYIASFLARAKYVPLDAVMATLEQIVSWVHSYIKEREDESHASYLHETARHGTFYSVCQALFYVLVFKHKQLLDRENGFQFLQNMHLERVVMSRLNPLKYCVKTVVDLFSSTMRIHQIVYCNSIVERNNRQCIPVSGRLEKATHVNPLETFFPFDPYLLKNSSRFIEDNYQEWEGRVPQPEEDVKDDEAGDGELLKVTPVSVPSIFESDHIFQNSFEKKSMSPGFSLIEPSPF